MIVFRSVLLPTNFIISLFKFLTVENIPLQIFLTFIIHSTDGHLCCFHFLAILYTAGTSMDERVSLSEDTDPFGYMPKSGMVGSWSRSIFRF